MTESFGTYELVEQIGTGGMAEVYLAKSRGAEGLEKRLVIKRILPEYSEQERFIEMFVDEATIAVNLNHPNIVQIYDFGKAQGDYYLAMEYVDGPNLAQLIDAGMRAGRPLPLGESVYVAIEVAKGLHYAHNRTDDRGEPLDIVHRDISPQNILISREGAVKIVDFGIAKAATLADVADSSESGREVVKGKHRYMSPEQAAGDAVDQRSDIFSLGAVLFELIGREPLFERESDEETLSMVKSAVVPDIRELNPEVPESLASVVYRALSGEPGDRYQHAREMKRELTDVLYEFDEVHDAMTLSDHVRQVGRVDSAESRRVDSSEQTRETDVTKSTAETTADGTQPVTVAREDEIEEGPASTGEPETTVVSPSRLRKEAVILVGELAGVMKLKQRMDQQHVWVQLLEEYTRIVDSIAFKSDGVVHRVDESGFLMALGLPVSSQNDSLRGVRAARDLQEAISGMNPSLEAPLELSVGVAIGDVVVERGEQGAFSWSFHGDSYQKAEEVADEAMPGEVLVSSQVYRRVEREFQFDEVSLSQAGDGADSAYKLVGPRSRDDRIEAVRRSYGSFYGREIPLKVLRDRYRRARFDETVSGVLLTGGPGVGKSTVVEEFLNGLGHRDVRIVRGMVSPFDRDVPMGPLAHLFAKLMRLEGDQDLRERRETLQTRIDALFTEVDSEEKALVRESLAYLFDIPSRERTFSQLTPEERQRRTFLSLRRVLQRFCQRRPVVFAIDDVHHLDSVSLEFFEQLFADAPGFSAFWVLAAEEQGWHAGDEARDRLVAAEALISEEIGELSEDDATALIDDLLRAQGVRTQELAADIYEVSGGNPLFIKEVVGILSDRGILNEPAEWRDVEGAEDRPGWLPTSVGEFISARIDRLEPEVREGVQRLSVLWNPFSIDVADILFEEDGAGDVVEALVEAGFLEPVENGGGEAGEVYRFCDELTQEVARRSLVPEKRRKLHERLVTHLRADETRSESGSLEETIKIARHLDGAGRADEAVAYYLRAAEWALDQQGASESVRLTDAVLDEVDIESEAGVRALDIRRRAWTLLGETERASTAIDRMLAVGEPHVDEVKQIRLLLVQSRFEREAESYDRSDELVEAARSMAAQTGASKSLGAVRYTEAARAMREGRLDEAIECVDEAISLHRESASDDRSAGVSDDRAVQLANALKLKGMIYRRLGRQRKALEQYEDALEVARASDEAMLVRNLLNDSGLVLAYLGRYSEALERYHEALEETRRLGHRRFEAEYLINIGHARYLLGDFEEAGSMIRRGIYLARRSEVPADIANGLVSLGLVHLGEDKLDEAEETLHDGLRRADSIPDVFLSTYATFALAEVHLQRGTQRAAETAALQAEDGLERARDAGMRWGEPVGAMLLARAAAARGDRDRAIELAQRAVDGLEAIDIHDAPDILYHYVQILPDTDEYRERRRRAIQRAKRLVEQRRDRIDDPDRRESYAQREVPNAILNVATLLESEQSPGD